MLAAILASKQSKLRVLAETWLVMGASSFSVWQNDELLCSWPADVTTVDATLTAPIRLGNKTLGEVRVAGCQAEACRQRLQAEAGLIAEIVKLEAELDSMTAELVQVQDQQIAFYNLSQTGRNSLNLDEVMQPFVEEVLRLIKAEGAFITLKHRRPPNSGRTAAGTAIQTDPSATLFSGNTVSRWGVVAA